MTIIDYFVAAKKLCIHLPRLHRYGLAGLSIALASICILQINNVGGTNQVITDTQISSTDNVTATNRSNYEHLHLTPPLPIITAEPSTEPSTSLAEIIGPSATQPKKPTLRLITESIKNGDTLSTVFNRANVESKYMYHLITHHPKAKSLAKIHPGHTLKFVLDNTNALVSVEYIQDVLNKEIFTRKGDTYKYENISKQPEIRLSKAEGIITQSLYMAGKKANLDVRLTMSLANIFGWDIDFSQDIRKNDTFKVVYEERYLDGKRLGSGEIVAAEFVNHGKTYRAVRYEDRNGKWQYYTPEGNTMRKAFLRSPIEFARISSPFNLNRKHPILNTIRAHKGTDYAAKTGTPIQASGDGKVVFAGKKSGYGNVLIIQHGQTYQTLYAHISRFGKKISGGTFVKQGQIVAYVGSTGLATGPHLHYEFRVNGVVRNPVTVELPNADPVAKAERDRFFAQTRPLVSKLLISKPEATQIASQEQAAVQAPM